MLDLIVSVIVALLTGILCTLRMDDSMHSLENAFNAIIGISIIAGLVGTVTWVLSTMPMVTNSLNINDANEFANLILNNVLWLFRFFVVLLVDSIYGVFGTLTGYIIKAIIRSVSNPWYEYSLYY